MNARQQFFELIAARYYEIEQAKLERAEILVNLKAAYRNGEISADQLTAISQQLLSARTRAGTQETEQT